MANSARRLKFGVIGIRELRKMTKGDPVFYAEPMREMLQEAVDLTIQDRRPRAPRKTGRMASGIRGSVQKAAFPKWGRVWVNVTRKKFRYPWALNYGRKNRTYHYRSSGPIGQKTFGWFTDELAAVWARIAPLVDKAARQTVGLWERNG